jgi:mono/diheme cytochrome c family protein
MLRLLSGLALVAAAGLALGYVLTRPRPLPEADVAGLAGDPVAGEQVFWASGCASCHAAPGAKDAERLVLSGGMRLASPFGTFVAPNISPDPTHGIGGWSLADFASAVKRGVSPEGSHLYPAFPYTTYTRMELQDVADLKAFMDRLPASDRANEPHEIGFPFNQRILLGPWKLLNLDSAWVMVDPPDAETTRGRYLVEAMGHCAECHTPRNPIGGLDLGRWMGGAPNPSGKGRIPNITPAALDWSAGDIAYYLKSGFTPDFDSAGGEMADVVSNMWHLPDADLAAIAAYVKALPPVAQSTP